MKRLCFGTLMKIMHQAKAPKVSLNDIYRNTMRAFGYDVAYYDDSKPKHLKSGKNDLSRDEINQVRSATKETAYEGVKNCVLPLIKSCYHVAVVRAIKAVLEDDLSIDNDTLIGMEEGYEKSCILQYNTFDFAELLANVLYFAIVHVKNADCKDAITEIGEDFIRNLSLNGVEVIFQIPGVIIEAPLTKTIRGNDFNNTFSEVASGFAIENGHPATVAFYRTEIGNCRIDFKTLKKFLPDHIGEYVLSRERIRRMIEEGNERNIGLHALLELMNSKKHQGQWDESTLGEILLYLFLEEVLGAPKILSKIEVQNVQGKIVSKCDGVHFNTTVPDGIPFHELVFGASDIVGNIETAINRAFERVANIRKNSDNEFQMVDSRVLNQVLDSRTAQTMKSIISPGSVDAEKPDMAFGIFLGYTLNINPEGLSTREFKNRAKEIIEKDIEGVKPYIASKIRELGLTGYSFYFYILPFNEAEKERTSILEEAFSGGMG